jgi:isoleucyl-tRNA synthetase
VQETLRRFLLTFWNTYSFFVTYANLDDFDPVAAAASPPAYTELDRWVLSELNALVEKVTRRLDEYDPTSSGRAIQDFVDDLSNWYVRRSRRRFWKGELDADKEAAYQTLYTCLVTVAKLMAPYTPFIADAVYQNLVRSVDPGAPESVHLADWPEADVSMVDQKLMDETRLVMRVVSLGRAARSKGQLKVRQPLAKATVFTQTAEQADGLRRLEDQVLDELNVKSLDVLALSEVFTETYARPDDLLAKLTPTSVLAEDDAGYAVGVETALTEELAGEGLARELVHKLQNMRKAAGFEIEDRIRVSYSGSPRAAEVLVKHAEYVRRETLADEVTEGAPAEGAHTEEQKIEGETVTLAVARS